MNSTRTPRSSSPCQDSGSSSAPGCSGVRGRPEPLPQRQVSQELRRHITHHPSIRHHTTSPLPASFAPRGSPTPSINGPFAASTTAGGCNVYYRAAGPAVTPTTKPCEPSPTASSASSTAASPTTPPTTKPQPGPTEATRSTNEQLDASDPGVSDRTALPNRVGFRSLERPLPHPVRRHSPKPGGFRVAGTTAAPPSSEVAGEGGTPRIASAAMSDKVEVPFPEKGATPDEVLERLGGLRGDDLDWRGGRAFSLVYNSGDHELEALLEHVANRLPARERAQPVRLPEPAADGARPGRAWRPACSAPARRRLDLLGRHREHLPRRADRPRRRPVRRAASPSRAARHRRPPPTRRSPRPRTTSTSSSAACPSAPTVGLDVDAIAGAIDDAHGPRGRLGALLPVRRDRPHPRARRAGRRARHALPRRRLPRRLAAAVVGAARRAGAAVGLPGRRA